MRVGLVGPLPPPSGGMANQTLQLAALLGEEGFEVELVQTNRAYRPAWMQQIPIVRAAFRLLAYVIHLWRLAPEVALFHVMANSGWSWHLFAAPAIWIAKWRGVPVVVNYRGGEAEKFFAKSFRWVGPTLAACTRVVVPSKFLADVFSKRDIETTIVPNIIDISRFGAAAAAARTPSTGAAKANAPHLLVARNLEAIYDNATAIRAFAEVLVHYPTATLTIAGTGPERDNLEKLVRELALQEYVTFTGRVDTQDMPKLYRSAQIMLNPTRVDNMPNSVLESLASGVPVVSTNVGGIPYLVKHEQTALLVDAGDSEAMAVSACRLLGDLPLQEKLVASGYALVQQFTWPAVRGQWLRVYRELVNQTSQ